MKKVYIVIIVAALLAVSFLYLSDSRKSLFTERLGDMTLTRYETGEVAAQQISNMYGLKDIPLAKGYSAVYSGRNGTMRIWVAEAPDHNAANDAFNAMNSMLGGSTGHEAHEFSGDVGQTESHKDHENTDMMNNTFSKPSKVDIMELVKPEVYMMQSNNLYNYYFLKMDYRMGRVYWISFDYPDEGYRKAMIRQAILNI
ncbi:MAG: hypothetical protein WA102_00225 [Candidatus Methanoperedens sp.]